jgi:hypothetical protein
MWGITLSTLVTRQDIKPVVMAKNGNVALAKSKTQIKTQIKTHILTGSLRENIEAVVVAVVV